MTLIKIAMFASLLGALVLPVVFGAAAMAGKRMPSPPKKKVRYGRHAMTWEQMRNIREAGFEVVYPKHSDRIKQFSELKPLRKSKDSIAKLFNTK